MSLAVILVYGVIFGLGPVIVLLLMRSQANVSAVRNLGLATAGLVLIAVAAGLLGAPGLVSAGLFWASWVLSMALMGQVLRLIVENPGARRWTAAVAAVGSTVPWFGILIARAMAG